SSVEVPRPILAAIAELNVSLGVDGHRGDLVARKGAQALAALEGTAAVAPVPRPAGARIVLGAGCFVVRFFTAGLRPDWTRDAPARGAIRALASGASSPPERRSRMVLNSRPRLLPCVSISATGTSNGLI